MAYEKPEVLVLSVAANAVRGGMGDVNHTSQDTAHKASIVGEGQTNSDTQQPLSSSSSGAYEADE